MTSPGWAGLKSYLSRLTTPYMSSSSPRSSVIWSIIAAAFIGPGTVTTATRVGAAGGWYYLPVLAAALLGGYLLLEAAARISLVGNRSLPALLGRSGGGLLLRLLVFGGLFVGCAAYQAGNLLGGLAGLRLFAAGLPAVVLVPVALLIAGLLFWGGTRSIGRLMGRLVILMGITFIFTALAGSSAQPPPEAAPDLSAFNMLALAGTTIVPYNFFLALHLGRGQELSSMRSGLALSFALGGVVTLAVLLTGRQLADFSTFEQLAQVLRQAAGLAGPLFLGIGLCAAGFSSALTAPLAAATGGRELFAWREGHWAGTLIWAFVLLAGLGVALFHFDIINVILAAQVINGFFLPFLAAGVVYLANDPRLLGRHVNTGWGNAGSFAVLAFLFYQNAAVVLGRFGMENSVPAALGVAGVAIIGLGAVVWRVRRG